MYSCLRDEFTRGDKNVFLWDWTLNLYTVTNVSDEHEFFLVYQETSLSKTLNLRINIQVSHYRGGMFLLLIQRFLKPNTYSDCENYFKLSQSVRCCGMERNEERTKIMTISRQPSTVQIATDQKQQKVVKYFSYFCDMKTKLCKTYT
jgi:hypothetical protein